MRAHKAETFVESDTWEIQGVLHYADGTPFNLGAGCNIVWGMKDSTGSVVLELSLGSGIVVLDATAGTCLITVSPAQSQAIGAGNYTDQLQATDPTGYVSTQWTGPINVVAS